MNLLKRIVLAVAFALGAASLAPSAHAQKAFDFKFKELNLPNGAGRVWVYVPEQAAGEKLPVVLIGPAGSRLFDGMSLGEEDKAEHVPYARAGFAVVTFDIPGDTRNAKTDTAFFKGVRDFKDSEGGVITARNALALALKNDLRLDESQIFVAGHSSAATLALTLCAKLERLKGCVAYAPAVDLRELTSKFGSILDRKVPGETAFLTSISPIALVDQIKSPVMIFNAKDDTNAVVQVANIDAYALKAKAANIDLKRIVVANGGHYDSMIDEGIPAGISWMNEQLGR